MLEGDDNGLPHGNDQVAQATGTHLPGEPNTQTRQRTVKPSKVIAGAARGVFDARIVDIENFYHLVNQRVNEQAHCDRETISVVVYLSDGTSRRLSSIEEFQRYSHKNNAIPTVVNLGLTVDIQFNGKGSVERQNVDIAIRASDIVAETLDMQVSEDRVRFASDKMQISVLASESDLGVISYTIDHTRLSWGLDIENLIQSHMSKLIQRPTRIDKLIKITKPPLQLITTLIVGLLISNQLIDLLFQFLFATEGAPAGSTSIDIASNWLLNGHVAKYIVISLVVAIAVVIMVSDLTRSFLKDLSKPRPSFILLTEDDVKRQEQRLKEHSRRWTRLAAVTIFNIAAIIAGVIFEDRILEYFKVTFS